MFATPRWLACRLRPVRRLTLVLLGACAGQERSEALDGSTLDGSTLDGSTSDAPGEGLDGSAPSFDDDAALEPEPLDSAPDSSVSAPGSASGRGWVLAIAQALEERSATLRTRNVTTPGWTWIELNVFDQTYPLSIDILGSNLWVPRGVIYMLPGGATNFRSSYMTPPEDNLAHFFRRQGYLVIGITPREDTVSPDTRDLSFMDAWGMQQHRDDIRGVVRLVQSIVPLPYELIGHSYGAASALDYAAAYPGEPQRVIALDIYSINPDTSPTSMRWARRTHQAYVQLMEQGVHADTSYADFPALARRGLGAPDGGVDQERAEDYTPYTSKQLVLFGMMYSAVLPGVHTSLTGLSGDWPMSQSTIVGDDTWAFRPSDDNRTFKRTSLLTLRLAAAELGGGLISMAFARDYWSVVALEEGHALPWSNIASRVTWINCELGYAAQQYGADLIRAGGNAQVDTQIVPDYGHADVLWSRTAREDVWSRLVAP